jgi:hypothetical protein
MTINQQREQQRWAEGLRREHQQGDHTTTMVGDNKQQEHAADGDGSNKEGKDGKGNGDGNEGTGR